MVLPTPCITFSLCLRQDYGREPEALQGARSLTWESGDSSVFVVDFKHMLPSKQTAVYLLNLGTLSISKDDHQQGFSPLFVCLFAFFPVLV